VSRYSRERKRPSSCWKHLWFRCGALGCFVDGRALLVTGNPNEGSPPVSSRHPTTNPTKTSTPSVSQEHAPGSWNIRYSKNGERAMGMTFFGSRPIQAAVNRSYRALSLMRGWLASDHVILPYATSSSKIMKSKTTSRQPCVLYSINYGRRGFRHDSRRPPLCWY
jgi:hypothetical protein